MDETTPAKSADEHPLDLDIIKARYEATTGRSWKHCQHPPTGDHWVEGARVLVTGMIGAADAEFIAHAREDIPALVAEVKRMRADLEFWEKVEAPRWVERHEAEKQQIRDEVVALTAQLQASQATIAEARAIYEKYLARGWAPPAATPMYDTLSRADTSTLATVKADTWDECLDTIDKNELNTEPARAGNPYRASIEQEGGE